MVEISKKGGGGEFLLKFPKNIVFFTELTPNILYDIVWHYSLYFTWYYVVFVYYCVMYALWYHVLLLLTFYFIVLHYNLLYGIALYFFYVGYFRVFPVMSGISGYIRVYWISSLFLVVVSKILRIDRSSGD